MKFEVGFWSGARMICRWEGGPGDPPNGSGGAGGGSGGPGG